MPNLQALYDQAIQGYSLDFLYTSYDMTTATSLERGFSFCGRGQSRMVYRRKNVVIKFPRGFSGLEDNICEAYAYHKYRKQSNYNGEFFAPCKLLSNGCLMMNFVSKMDFKDMPRWTFYIDSSQCGMFNGRVVAYDGAHSLIYLKDDALRWAGII